MQVIEFDAAAMDILRRELEPLGMRIGFSERAGYFVTDIETSETMMVINSPARFLSLTRRFVQQHMQEAHQRQRKEA